MNDDATLKKILFLGAVLLYVFFIRIDQAWCVAFYFIFLLAILIYYYKMINNLFLIPGLGCLSNIFEYAMSGIKLVVKVNNTWQR